ncbi:hypothetical protein, partial [Pseudarthrobacter sp. NPDC057230]|uniref:hypothetical protein n=1 Tax=Pseudarthrobacter sp. NPDC057230 TaxID=3346057 RepID=UPI003637C701
SAGSRTPWQLAVSRETPCLTDAREQPRDGINAQVDASAFLDTVDPDIVDFRLGHDSGLSPGLNKSHGYRAWL